MPSDADSRFAFRVTPARLLRTLAILLAIVLSWLSRYAFDPDGVAYTDIARAYLRGDWHNALNTYWSPLYSWLLAIGFAVFHPAIAWETYIPHAVVLLGFLAALRSGEWLLSEWERWQGPPEHRALSTIAFYVSVMWAALHMMAVDFTSADIFLIAVWFIAGALLIRMRSGTGNSRDAVWFGVTLAFGFFTKGGFLGAIPCFLVVLAFMTGLRDRRPYIAAALTFCVLLPFVAAISLAHGRLVLTDAGRLNYIWLVNGVSVEGYHQSDLLPPVGIPHPAVRLLDDPRVLSYRDHLAGTIPVHSDPAWWTEGYPLEFDWDRQWAVFINEAAYTFVRAVRAPALLFFVVFLMAGGWRRTAEAFARLWFLWLPVFGMLFSYSLIHAEDRYTAPSLALLGFVLIAAGWKSRLSAGALPFILAGFIAIGAASLRHELAAPLRLWNELAGRRQPDNIGTVQIAGFLHDRSPFGPRIGLIGSSIVVPWLELARGQIVAVVPGRLGNESDAPGNPQTLSFGQVDRFWRSDAETQRRVFAAMRSAGAEWVVSDSVPVWADVSGWEIAGQATLFRPAGTQRPWCYARNLYE